MQSLKKIYDRYNKQYFGGKLPDSKLEWAVLKMDRLAEVDLSLSVPTIYISLELYYLRSECVVKLNVLHEMVHIFLERSATPTVRKRYSKSRNGHGPEFSRQMKKLARLGAMDDLW